MKIIKKIGTIFIGLITCIQTFFYEVYADYLISHPQPDYGIREPSKVANPIMDMLGKLKILIIPVIVLIGFIVYSKKSKNDENRNILKIAIFIMSIVIFVLVISILMSIIKIYF